ncbi:hypothetical protein DV736_g4652, partial [Chaetothyriales sp. CBS 134916]
MALVLTSLRLYVRARLVKFFGWDDFFNALAMVTMLVVLGLVVTAAKNGLGRHFIYTEMPHAVFGIMLLRITEFMLIISTVFVKISISLFLMKLFIRSKPWKIFLWNFIAFNTITSLLDAAFIFPQCTPVQRNWNKSVEGHCWSDAAINGIGIMQGSIAAATDFTLSFLPIVFLWNVKIISRVKLGICAIMALGFALEANFGVIAAAAPSVRPLLGGRSGSTNNSKPKSRTLRFSNVRSTQNPRHSWLGVGGSHNGGVVRLQDEISESGNEIEMFPSNSKHIVKTTEFKVTRM